MTMILLVLLVLWSCHFHVLLAQKGDLELALPICNSRDLSYAEFESFEDIVRIANSTFPCRTGNDQCCENSIFDVNIRIACNAQENLCEIRTPSSSRPGRKGNLNIVSIARCARPGERCKITSNICSESQIIEILFSYLESERLLCAWDRGQDRSPIGCLVFNVAETETFPRKERCDPHIGKSIRSLQDFLGTPEPVPSSEPGEPGELGESPESPQPSMSAVQTPQTPPSASPPASPTTLSSSSPAVCFPGHATVKLLDNRRVRMDELRVGDVVRVSDRLTSRVFTFSHRDEHILAQFVRLRTVASRTLMLTPGHLVYLEGRHLVPAERVYPGHKLILANGQVDQVQSTELTTAKGIYNPQTLHGDIIVDGFIVSTFTTSVPHSAAHAMLAPVRAVFSQFGFRFRSLESDRNALAAFLRNRFSS